MATTTKSKTTEEERDSDNSDDIQMLSQVKEDLDEADIMATTTK